MKSSKDLRAALIGAAPAAAAKPAAKPATVTVPTVVDSCTFAPVNGFGAALFVRFPANPEFKGSHWQTEHDEIALYADGEAANAFIRAENQWSGNRKFSRMVRLDALEAALAAVKARK